MTGRAFNYQLVCPDIMSKTLKRRTNVRITKINITIRSYLSYSTPSRAIFELREIADQGSVVLASCRGSDVDTELTGKETASYNPKNFQTALDNFRKEEFLSIRNWKTL